MSDSPYDWPPWIPEFHRIPSSRGTVVTDLPVLLAAIKRENPEELSGLLMELWGRLALCENVSKKRRAAITKATDPAQEAKETWLTPAKEGWESVMGVGSFAYGQAARYLAPLREGYSDAEIGARLAFYCRNLKRNDELKYASYRRFAETIGAHNPHELAFDE